MKERVFIMLTVRLPEDMERALEDLAKETNRSKSFYVSQALELYLDRHEEELLKAAVLMEKAQTTKRKNKE